MTKILTDDPTTEERQAFLEALTALSHEHGIYIDGDGSCGCCGATSPHLRPIPAGCEDVEQYAYVESELYRGYVRAVCFEATKT